MEGESSILIVDDDESTCRSLSLILEKKGYETETADTGREAMDKVRRRFFNVALVDIKLPDMEGIDLMAPLKELHPDMAMVMITGHASLENAVRALNEGASAYITKPLSMDEMLTAIKEVLEKQHLVMENKKLYQEVQQELAERKRAEKALRESEERLSSFMQSATDSFLLWDSELNLVEINEATLRYRPAGTKKEELIGKNILDIEPELRQTGRYDQYLEVMKTGKPFIIDDVVSHPRFGDVHLTVKVFKVGDGLGMIVMDITERKKMEEQLLIADRLASVGELAAGIAHEMNNPLTSVIGFSELLMNRDVPDDMKEDLKVVYSEANRTAKIVNNLLTFSRKHPLEKHLVDINSIIDKTLELRAYEHKVNNIQVDIRFASDLPEVIADQFQLLQVFLNIIINAVYFMLKAHNKGILTVITEKEGDIIRASFTDDGPGISEEALSHLFDPFFTTKEVGKGTGLGLSICHGIMTEHGGKIYAESRLGKGATFFVELPITVEYLEKELDEPSIDKYQKVVGAEILVVDDEPSIRQLLNRVLTIEGYNVETSDNASDALKKLQSKKYDLILLDIRLPGMSGIELYQRIQKMAPFFTKRVVFVTGSIMGPDTRAFIEETQASCIMKPFNINQLKREVNRILEQGT